MLLQSVARYEMSTKRHRTTRYAPHVGSNHRIYSLPSLDDDGNIIYTRNCDEGCRLESFIEIYLRDGNTLHNTDSMTIEYECPQLEEVRKRLITNYDNFQNKSHAQFVYKLSIVECFYLELLPQCLFSKYIQKLQSQMIAFEDGGKFYGNNSREPVEFCPLLEIELIAFIEYLITDKNNTTSFGVNGRGVGYKSLEGFITVVRTIHRAAGIPEGLCPTCGERVKTMIKDVFDRYHPEGAATVDLASFLPDAYAAVFGSDLPHFDKLMRWSMLLISINIFARASEMTEYLSISGRYCSSNRC